MPATYFHVPAADTYNEEDHDVIELVGLSPEAATTKDSFEDEYVSDDHQPANPQLIGWEEPILPSCIITLLQIPILLLWVVFAYRFTGRLWSSWIFVLHLHLRISTSRRYFYTISSPATFGNNKKARAFATTMDIVMLAIVYPLVVSILTQAFFLDVDDTINLDWRHTVKHMRIMTGLGIVIAISRLCLCVAAYLTRKKKQRLSLSFDSTRYLPSISERTQQIVHKTFWIKNVLILVLHSLCILSVWSHFHPWPDVSFLPHVSFLPQECDPLDPTLCALPFPSFHHLEPDPSTNTGFKVHLKGLPPLRGGIPFSPKFLNSLDGFSTMAPILFYMEGLKEAHEAYGRNTTTSGLQGPSFIENSITELSITLLINVDDHTLVPHSAEIDYLDPKRPLVMVIPAQPLRHGTHYAVAVVNATDVHGNRLPPSQGLEQVLQSYGTEQYFRFMDIVLPALRHTATWTNFTHDPQSVQLLFDFITISEGKQLGHVRAIRNFALEAVRNWKWQDHVELVKEIQHDCSSSQEMIARTYHIHLDVPSFLKERNRYSILDNTVFITGKPIGIEKAKVIVRVPCSVERAALGLDSGKPVQTIMEYGHGLFYHRGEVRDGFLSRMANENGYILMAMDWRGMSVFDLPNVIKTLVGNPDHFQSIRDNLVQGYSEKLVLQHFARNGMLDWLKIDGVNIPTKDSEQPASVFYGISQGGILGAGYLALSGNTTLIDRGVLGSPGTPFTSILTRSLDFVGYDVLMLINFYNNRHVRLLLSLVQMGWDSVEASGLLAPNTHHFEPLPRVLMQTGLGDAIVPTGACEAMTRAMHGKVLPNNPRSIFGVPVAEAGSEPSVVLTELKYEEDFNSLPLDNTLPKENRVHFCVRWDPAMISQIESFANTGQVIDPCTEDQCKRLSSKHC